MICHRNLWRTKAEIGILPVEHKAHLSCRINIVLFQPLMKSPILTPTGRVGIDWGWSLWTIDSKTLFHLSRKAERVWFTFNIYKYRDPWWTLNNDPCYHYWEESRSTFFGSISNWCARKTAFPWTHRLQKPSLFIAAMNLSSQNQFFHEKTCDHINQGIHYNYVYWLSVSFWSQKEFRW